MTGARPVLRSVRATRYLAPLREGGSLPGLLEADDLGIYVVKFRGAGQGRKALVAEVIVGELARALGFLVPELVVAEIDPALAPGEPDEEVQDLLRASPGANLGMDYLPGSLGFDPAAEHVDPGLAARLVWFDAYVQNVDRSWRNPNLLLWHGRLWLIDHGAALWFHHDWGRSASAPERRYPSAAEHVLLGAAGPLGHAQEKLAPLVTPEVLTAAVAAVPGEWLAGEEGFDGPDEVRAAYVRILAERLAAHESWLPAVEDARAARA